MMVRAVALVAVLALAGCGASAPAAEPSAETASSQAAKFPVTLGKGTAYRKMATYPVVAENLSGQALRLLKVDCSFYDKDGALIDHGNAIWFDVPIGARQSGSVSISSKLADRFECSASPAY